MRRPQLGGLFLLLMVVLLGLIWRLGGGGGGVGGSSSCVSSAAMKCPSPPPLPPCHCPPQGSDASDSKDECFTRATAKACRLHFPTVPVIDISRMSETDVVSLPPTSAQIPISFLTAPRAFDAETTARQRASILSWQLQPGTKEIMLIGDEPGIAEFAAEWGLSHATNLQKNPSGIPLMNSLFQTATKFAKFGVHCFVNTDISLPPGWWKVIQSVLPTLMAQDRAFLIAGPRLVFPKGVIFNPVSDSWSEFRAGWIDAQKYSMPVIDGAIDWFVFRSGSYDNLPPFLLGRFVWDSWMVDMATRNQWNTVTTFTTDRGVQTTYGMHWDHSREHQKDKKHGDERVANGRIASQHGGLGDFGRLRGMELLLEACSAPDEGYCLKRRFDYDVLAKKLPPRKLN